MARNVNSDDLTPFAQWFTKAIEYKGSNLKKVADAIEVDYSYLWKVMNAHKPAYIRYRRPGYEVTRDIGRFLGDMEGALKAAEFNDEQDGGGVGRRIPNLIATHGIQIVTGAGWRDVELPDGFDDFPLELREAMAYSTFLQEDAQKYLYSVWREQARHHADLAQKATQTEEEIRQARRELEELQEQKRAQTNDGQ